MSKESNKEDHIELTISAMDGSQYRCVFHHDNPHDMTALGNIQEWLGSPMTEVSTAFLSTRW